jgi:stage IV sporulation protein FB
MESDRMTFFSWSYAIFLISAVGAILIHELSHAAAARMLGVKIKKFGLAWRGVYIVRECGSDAHNLLITMAGPLSNLATMAACLVLSHYVHIPLFWVFLFACSQALFLFNVLPLPSSDGLRALRLVRALAR